MSTIETKMLLGNNKANAESQALFGYFFDKCLLVNYSSGDWRSSEVIDHRSVSYAPSTVALHYAQSVFEGALAIRNVNGELVLFRMGDNLSRLNRSAKKLCMPAVNAIQLLSDIKKLLQILDEQIPRESGTLIYIRPVYFATDSENLGIRISESYSLVVLVALINESARNRPEEMTLSLFPRSFYGGTGSVKASCNYGPTLVAKSIAKKNGFSNVIFTDTTGMFIEAAAADNIFFIINENFVYTPTTANETILPGITRDSVIKILTHWKYTVYDYQQIGISQVKEWADLGIFNCAFSTSTAGGISLIKKIKLKDDVIFSENEFGLVNDLCSVLKRIQTGDHEDIFHWIEKIDNV